MKSPLSKSRLTMSSHPSAIEAIINYHLPLADSGPPLAYNVSTAGSRRVKHNPRRLAITNIRGHETEFDLDTHGFQLVQNFPSEDKNYDDDDRIKKVVYKEVDRMLKKV